MESVSLERITILTRPIFFAGPLFETQTETKSLQNLFVSLNDMNKQRKLYKAPFSTIKISLICHSTLLP